MTQSADSINIKDQEEDIEGSPLRMRRSMTSLSTTGIATAMVFVSDDYQNPEL
jgi:hypothetical protein